MTDERYNSLSNDIPEPKLTQSEWDAGWHFCCEWDNLLIGPGMDGELAACSCFAPDDVRDKMCVAARIKQTADMMEMHDGDISFDTHPDSS